SPYAVDVSFWADGPHVVSLRAVAKDGESWNRTFHVTLASSPPTMTSPTLTPRGSDVLISVVSRDAVRVTARFNTTSGTPLVVPLTGGADGRFSATASPPADWTSVVLTATGSSGAESSVVLQKPAPGKGVPAPSTLALLAVGLALARIARRRA